MGAQRAAMKKLSFLAGRWHGEARLFRGRGGALELIQTEDAQYKLDGLVLIVVGVGLNKSDGTIALQALGVISYDDEAGTYHMRAFNDGRWLETDVKLSEEGMELTWGFTLGEIRSHSVLRINERGEWTENAELTVGSQPPRKLLELTVSAEK